MDVIMHIGAAKCGSSALQHFLSRNYELTNRQKQTIRYCCFMDCSRGIVYGKDLSRIADSKVIPYCSSNGIKKQLEIIESSPNIDHTLNKLQRLGGTPLFSSEGWSNPQVFKQLTSFNFFERLDFSAELLFYIRPQANVINSSWWEFGAWTGLRFAEWFELELNLRGHWDYFLDVLSSQKRVRDLKIRILQGDIVQDFLEVYDIAPQNVSLNSQKVNSSLPGAVLRGYQQTPALRALKKKAKYNFVLSQYLGDIKGQKPWVLTREHLNRIADTYRQCNERVYDYLDEEQKKLMRDDPAWWGEAPLQREPADPDDYMPPLAERDEVLGRALQSVFELDLQVRKYKSREAAALPVRLWRVLRKR